MADILEEPGDGIEAQPDIEIVVQGLRNLTTQVARVVNIPAFDQGAQFLAVAQQIRQDIAAIRQDIAVIQHQIQGLRDDISRLDKNGLARMTNNNAGHNEARLEPLYGVNGQLVPNFPVTLAGCMALNAPTVSTLLLALGLGVDGDAPTRKRRFNRYIGLRYTG